MRHMKSGRNFSRTSSHRTAMFRNMAASLFKHELIRTTLPKAKELRRVAEPLITLAKTDGVANRRLAFARLRDKVAVGKLFVELGPRYRERKGGYLRILKCGVRAGDAAPMAYVELVDRPRVEGDAAAEKASTRVRRTAPAGFLPGPFAFLSRTPGTPRAGTASPTAPSAHACSSSRSIRTASIRTRLKASRRCSSNTRRSSTK